MKARTVCLRATVGAPAAAVFTGHIGDTTICSATATSIAHVEGGLDGAARPFHLNKPTNHVPPRSWNERDRMPADERPTDANETP